MHATEAVTAKAIKTTPKALILVFADREVSISWTKCPRKLAHAAPKLRREAELSPGGYGIHWPSLDEDLSVAGLLRLAEK